MSLLALSDSFEYLCGGSTAITIFFIFFQIGDRLYYGRQILPYKDASRPERVKVATATGENQVHSA